LVPALVPLTLGALLDLAILALVLTTVVALEAFLVASVLITVTAVASLLATVVILRQATLATVRVMAAFANFTITISPLGRRRTTTTMTMTTTFTEETPNHTTPCLPHTHNIHNYRTKQTKNNPIHSIPETTVSK
jgi:hypothetical protein